MMLNAAGVMVEKCWREISDHFPWVRLGELIVMPNHIHGIVHVGAQFIAPHNCNQYGINSGAINQGAINQGAINRAPTVGDIVRNFKARCTHGINQLNGIQGQPIWQRNYYEHIIRNEQAYFNIVEYIRSNPKKWQEDTYYTAVIQGERE
jgi:REP element-mobilizing transposase RayT